MRIQKNVVNVVEIVIYIFRLMALLPSRGQYAVIFSKKFELLKLFRA